jgi:predicted nucleic acid-binding protein
MKSIIFDTGPIISLTLTHLMWTLDFLKKQYKGEFIIPLEVKKELIDRPIETKKFKFEALHTLRYIKKGTITVYENNDFEDEKQNIMFLANNCFYAKGNNINIIHGGEAEVIALALKLNPDAIVIDERTTRDLIENPWRVKEHLSNKLHTRISVDQKNFDKLRKMVSHLKVIRSIEIVIADFEMGILDRYLPDCEHAKENLLESIFWGLKLNGCAVLEESIQKLIHLETNIKKFK